MTTIERIDKPLAPSDARCDRQIRELHKILLGEVSVPTPWFGGPLRCANGSRRVWAPVAAFVVRWGGRSVLIDSGPPPGMTKLGRGRRAIVANQRAEWRLAEQLALRQIDTEEVQYVVITDPSALTTYGVRELPRARAVIAERAMVKAQQLCLLDPTGTVEWCPVAFTGGSAEVSAYGAFSRTLDLFGDGVVRLISLPGYTVGQLAVLVDLGPSRALVAGCAAPTIAGLESGWIPFEAWDTVQFRRSAESMLRYLEGDPACAIFPGRDPDIWNELPVVTRGEVVVPNESSDYR